MTNSTKKKTKTKTNKSKKKNGLLVTKIREFSVKMGSFGNMYMTIWGVLTQNVGSLGDR